jgi:hypothetical protein
LHLHLHLTAAFDVLFPALATGDVADPWALKPAARPEAPAGRAVSKDPIDALIAAGHEATCLQPEDPADRRILLRRVSLDLIGLPPTPEQRHAFLLRK